MEADAPLLRLQSLQRDLMAFSEARLPTVNRLSAELDASIEDLRKFLDKKRKNEASRKQVLPIVSPRPEKLKIGDMEYKVNDEFRQAAVMIADELDLDELDAAKLCTEIQAVVSSPGASSMAYRAVLQFQDFRCTLLDCMRLLLQQHAEVLTSENNFHRAVFQDAIDKVMKTSTGVHGANTELWQKSIDGLSSVEKSLKKVSDHRQTILMTGMSLQGEMAEALEAQQLLLTRQHESLVAVLTSLLSGSFEVAEPQYRALISKASTLESSVDIAIHYLPVLTASAAYIGSSDQTHPDTARNLHKLYENGGQLQWKMPDLKAAAVVIWLAEYSHRFEDTHADPRLRVADRQRAEQERFDLFMQAVKDKAFDFILAACKWLKPEVWHDPAKLGLVGFLLSDAQTVQPNTPRPSATLVTLVMQQLQNFSAALIDNMADPLRRLKVEEDDQRRLRFSVQSNDASHYEPDLERLIVIMSYAYEDDPEAAQDFWADKESNLYGFLRWVSQRLPTPRVAAFCELLRSLANDTKSADHAHRFLLEDTTMISGKLRKTYNVSWAQIFAELETFASSVKDKPVPQGGAAQDGLPGSGEYIEGVETSIMLEAYLRLASHVCRISPDARNWLLREQPFNLGDVMFQLASSGIEGRLQASCFHMLSAMLADKVAEVNDGMWVMLDNWITAGGPAASSVARPAVSARSGTSERHYLSRFNDRPDTATAFVALLTALVAPSPTQSEPTLDSLPFPESLGAPNRHAGIDSYIDFAVGTVFRLSAEHLRAGAELTEINVLRFTCLELIFICLSTFNEDLVLLANTTNIAVDSNLKASSLATYARLHPFARVMEWLFNNNVVAALFATAQQDIDALNEVDIGSPHVQATLKSLQVMNLAMKLQATYVDIVMPIVKTQSTSRSQSVANAALASFEDVMLSQLGVMVDIAAFSASYHAELSLEALSLLQKLAASRKLSDAGGPTAGRGSLGNRLVGALADFSDAIAAELIPAFQITDMDIETGEPPLKAIKARAIIDMLNSSLDASLNWPNVAHCLLGFSCTDRKVEAPPGSAFDAASSLFHAIAAACAQTPIAVPPTYLSWLLGIKRGCLEVIVKLALSPLTSGIVRTELLSMEFLDAISRSNMPAAIVPLWDSRGSEDPDTLLSGSAGALRDFTKVRELYFLYCALQLRSAAEQGAYSVQGSAMNALQGAIRLPIGEPAPTMSIFDLFDFADLESAHALDVAPKYLAGLELSICTKGDPEIGTAYDQKLVEELLVLHKRELLHDSTIRDASEEQQLDDEIKAVMASLLSKNNFRLIQNARLGALEAWTELLSLMMTAGGLDSTALTALAMQGLQTVLPKFEKSIGDSLESAALLAKLMLVLVPPASAALAQANQQNANTTHERLISAYRLSLKAITDGDTTPALRDVCYRTCLAVSGAAPLKIDLTAMPHAKRLLELVRSAGDRVITVIGEDAFSGRGPTRVSAVLFLNSLSALFGASRNHAALIRVMQKLNFMPVLIDTSIGCIATAFQEQSDELVTTLAYFHSVLAFLLRICQTSGGTQLVLQSGFFSAVSDSRLFSTDPDIGLDIDNPVALREFYKLLSAILRVIVIIVVSRGAENVQVMRQAKEFLQQNRFSMQAVFKRTSVVQKTSGPPEKEALIVAEEFSKLLLVTGFLEDDESSLQRAANMNSFT